MGQPTEAQIKAGNYSKGHVYAHGMRISIENEADSVRSGTDKNGEPWDSRMQHDYGYIRGTEGADGDHLDVFLGPDFKSREVPVFVIDQHDPDTKDFDEHKVMLGFKTKDDALRAYMGNYPDGHTGAQAITTMPIDQFKQWMVSPSAKKSVSKTKKYANGGLIDGQQELSKAPEGYEITGYSSGADPTPIYGRKTVVAQPQISFEDFSKRITPNMLDAQGKFRAPEAGVNFMNEGLTPEETYKASTTTVQQPDVDGGGLQGNQDVARSLMLDPRWHAGPAGTGVVNAVGHFAGEVTKNPALMAALTAGVTPYVNSGLQSAGMSASTAKMATPLVMNAGKTMLNGGSAADALKGAGVGYVAGQVGDAAVANNPVPEVLSPSMVRYLTNTAIKGKKPDPFGFASAFTASTPSPQSMADGGAITPLSVDRAMETNEGRENLDRQVSAQDLEHLGKWLKQIGRGWVAGTAGLPGDLTHLAKKIAGWGATKDSPVDKWTKTDPVMPTSEFYKEWLPGASEDPRLQRGTSLGSLGGGIGMNLMAKPVVTAGRMVVKGAAPELGALSHIFDNAVEAQSPMTGGRIAQQSNIPKSPVQ